MNSPGRTAHLTHESFCFLAFPSDRSQSHNCQNWSYWRGSGAAEKEEAVMQRDCKLKQPTNITVKIMHVFHLCPVSSPPFRAPFLFGFFVSFPGVPVELFFFLFSFYLFLLFLFSCLYSIFVFLLDSNSLIIYFSILQFSILSKK